MKQPGTTIAVVFGTLIAWGGVPVVASDFLKVANEAENSAPAGKRAMYVPPSDLAPLRENTRVQSGATRNAGGPAEVRVLAPEHTGFTASAQPTLFWYTARRIDTPVELVIETVDGPLAPAIVDTRLAGPFERGLHAVPLAKFGARLEVGREYAWRIVVVVDEKRRANDVFAGANIARAAHSKSLRETLNAAAPSDHPKIYASAGLWYDALTSIDALRSTAGQRTRAVANCRDMLDAQALKDVSCD